MSKSEAIFEFQANALKLAGGMVREYKFDTVTGRKWRFDFAWPEYMVAVECEGVTSFGKNLGRHQTAKGYSADLEKYNAATLQGWRVLRFNQQDIKGGGAIALVGSLLKQQAVKNGKA